MRVVLQLHQFSITILCIVLLLSTLFLQLSNREGIFCIKKSQSTPPSETGIISLLVEEPITEAVGTQKTIAPNFCATELCVLPFIDYSWTAMMNFAPQYGPASCAIPKSFSTVSMAIFCYLYNDTSFVAHNRNLPDENWNNRLCSNLNEVYTPDPDLLHAENWTHIAVVRHPIDQFLSGFVDKCVNEPLVKDNHMVKSAEWCFGCKFNISCFVHKLYNKLIMKRTSPPNIYIEDHFYPQSWFCNFRAHIDNYVILKHPSKEEDVKQFYDDLGVIFAFRKVPAPLIQNIKDQLTKKRTEHATTGSKNSKEYKKLLMDDRELLLTVLKIYYFDFVISGYDFPQVPM